MISIGSLLGWLLLFLSFISLLCFFFFFFASIVCAYHWVRANSRNAADAGSVLGFFLFMLLITFGCSTHFLVFIGLLRW